MKTKEQLDQLVTSGFDAYAVLGATPSIAAQYQNAKDKSITNAYRAAITGAGEDRTKNEEINTALAILEDPELKKRHDEALGYGEKWKATIDTSSLRAISDDDFKRLRKQSAQPAQKVNPKLIEEVKKEQEAAQIRIHAAMRTRKSPAIIALDAKVKVRSPSPATVAGIDRGANQQTGVQPAKNPFGNNLIKPKLRANSDSIIDTKPSTSSQIKESDTARSKSVDSPTNQVAAASSQIKESDTARSKSVDSPTNQVAAASSQATEERHLSGDDLKQAIIKNRTSWQKFTASYRANGNELTKNELTMHTELANAKSVIIGNQNSNQIIKQKGKEVRSR